MLKDSKPKSGPKHKANKVVIIGDSNVGKTCLITRYVDDKFGDTQPTIGALHRMKSINGTDLDLWDTAGQERFKSMIPMYYKGAVAIIISFDLTCQKSFQNAEKWLNEVETSTNKSIIVLVGNKADLENRAVNSEQIKQFASSKSISYFECSAKNNININEIFIYIANKIRESPIQVEKNNINLNLNGSDETTCCGKIF